VPSGPTAHPADGRLLTEPDDGEGLSPAEPLNTEVALQGLENPSLGLGGSRSIAPRRLCEHMFVTSQGSAYGRFIRALATGNLTIIKAAAAELPRVGLQDALEVCLLFREEAGGRFERAAVRWLGRFALGGSSETR
jgi:hypothetical protein